MAEIRPSKPSDSVPTANNGSIGESQMNFSSFQNQEEQDLGPGIYAIQSNPYINMLTAGYSPSNNLIPLKYHIPTRENVGEEGEQGGGVREQPHRNPVIVRRFQFQFQLDLALLIKLAAVVFLFSQDGSTQRLSLLICSALFVYLYQTGTLAPVIRWLRQAAQPPPPRAQVNNNDVNNQRAEGNHGVENPNPNPNPDPNPGENLEQAVANNPNPNPNGVEGQEGGNRNGLWGIIKEIQMIVVGFVASLLPGFQHRD